MNDQRFIRSLRYDQKYAASALSNIGWDKYIIQLAMNDHTTFKYLQDDEKMIEFLDFIDGNGFIILGKWSKNMISGTWIYAMVKRLPNDYR